MGVGAAALWRSSLDRRCPGRGAGGEGVDLGVGRHALRAVAAADYLTESGGGD
jgi:hypothetical protein